MVADDAAPRLVEQLRERTVVVPRAERDDHLAGQQALGAGDGVEVDVVDHRGEQRPRLRDAGGEPVRVRGGEAALAGSRDEGLRELCHDRILPWPEVGADADPRERKHRMSVEVGQEAPDFELQNQFGTPVRLSSFRGEKNVVLVFFPKAFTATCTE